MKKLFIHYYFLLASIWTVIIFALCSTPGKYVPTSLWLDLLSFDKFVHATIFFVLIALWLIFLITRSCYSSINKIIVLVACVLYGGLLEIMQATLFSQRSADWFDFIANSVGCLVGLLFINKRGHKIIRPQ